MDFNHFVGIVRRWWITLLFAVLVGAAAGYTIADATPPTYETAARVLVGPLNTDRDTQEAGGRLAETYAELAGTFPVVDAATRRLDPATGPLDPNVRATADDVTRIVTISVGARTAEGAAGMANAVAAELQALVAQGAPEGQVSIVESAAAPGSPSAPNVSLIVTLSVLTALVGAVGLALLFEHLIDAVQRPDELLAATGATFVAALSPRTRLGSSGGRGGALVVASEPASPAAVDLRVIATNLELALAEHDRTVLVVGVDDRSGSAAIAGNLATVIAEAGRSVVLVDLTGGNASLSVFPEVTAETLTPGTAQPIAVSDGELSVVVAGRTPVMEEAHASAVLEGLDLAAERVILHAPALPASADALVWGRVADATVLVAQRGSARRAVVGTVADQLRWAGATIVGAVLSDRTWETERRPLADSVRSALGRGVSVARRRQGSAGAAAAPAASGDEQQHDGRRAEELVTGASRSPDARPSRP